MKIPINCLVLCSSTRGLDARDSAGCSALHYACLLRHHGVAKQLLERGAMPNAKNERGEAPAHYVLKTRDEQVRGWLE